MDTTQGQFMQRVGASLISGSILAVCLYPFDTFKRNAQLNGGLGYRQAFTDTGSCADYCFKELKGTSGLYRGASTFFVGQVLIAFFQFTTFDAINSSVTGLAKKD